MSAPDDLSAEARVSLRGVAFLACGYDVPGGMEGQARGLAGALADLGCPVTFVTTLSEGVRAPLRSQHGLVDVFRMPVPAHVDWATSLHLLELFALGIVRARRPRLNLLYAVHHETGAIASRVGAATQLPVVVKLACSGPHGDAAAVARHPDRRRIRAALRSVERVVAISEDLAREAAEELGIHPARVERLPNGVDLARFRPRPRRGEEPRIVFVGRLAAQKRVDVLLRAFAALGREDTRLVLVGDGPLRGELESLARELGIGERVRFTGRLADPRPELREASAFALPSAAEGASNALLEALAMGIPSVATDLPGNAELVGGAALVVPVGDPAALAAALERLLSDSELAARLRAAGPERAAAFDLSEVARRHLALFHELAAAEDGEAPAGPFLRALGSTSARGLGAGLRSVAGVLRRKAGLQGS